jgi:cytoskeleton protein RodZ
MESPGKFLKRERETRNISLEEISKFTKVKEHYLKAIEEDQYQLLPAVLYVKGFLSVYAKYLTLNPKDILLQYENYLKSLLPPETIGLPQQAPPKKKSARAWLFFSLISIVTLLPIIRISYPSGHPVSPSPAIRQELRSQGIYPAQQNDLLSHKTQRAGKTLPI